MDDLRKVLYKQISRSDISGSLVCRYIRGTEFISLIYRVCTSTRYCFVCITTRSSVTPCTNIDAVISHVKKLNQKEKEKMECEEKFLWYIRSLNRTVIAKL